MSFDLYFCSVGNSQIDHVRLRRHLNALNFTTESMPDDGSFIQFEYCNPATKVYCMFDLASGAGTAQDDDLQIPSGHVGAGLSVSINFLRPHFFALEIMPILSSVADSFGMALYDAQEDKVYPPGTSSDILVQSWMRHNEWATRALARDNVPVRKPYLAPEQSAYWWRYTRALDEFQISLAEDVFVPSLMLMTDADAEVKLAVVWSAEVRRGTLWQKRVVPLPQVFPACDYLLLAWGKLNASRLEKTIVPYSTAMAFLAPLIDDIDGPVEGLKVLRPARQSDSAKVFERLPRLEIGALKLISSDDFVDVPIEA